MSKKILVLNFGSTSSKMAVYQDLEEVVEESISHPTEELAKFKGVFDQVDYRKAYLMDFLKRNNFQLTGFDCIISRGGTWKPVPSGVYEIKENMVRDLVQGDWGFHASGIGCKIGLDLANDYNIPAITVDSPNTDEYCKFARYSGLEEIERQSVLHALNHKAVARRYAREKGKVYEEINLIVVHMGGGISVVAHERGQMIDSNSALDGDGPFSPERTGDLPVGPLVDLCYSGKYTRHEMERLLVGEGGLMSYLGTTDGRKVQEMIDGGDKKAQEVYLAMGYQIAKTIGAMAAVLGGDLEAILFTGGLAHSQPLVEFIEERVAFIGDCFSYPGEMEMLALAENANRFLGGKTELLDYDEVEVANRIE